MAKAKEVTIKLEPIKKITVRMEIIGDTDLMLNCMSRQTKKIMIFQQENPKKTPLPPVLEQDSNPWESIITSIHWLNPIEYHDEDISLYSQEEWEKYMKENKPCILSQAFIKSFKQAVITLFSSSGLKGTDLKRTLVSMQKLYPIEFAENRIYKNIVSTNEDGSGSPVLCECNIFSGWTTTVEFSAPQTIFTAKSLLNVVQATGEFIGIGTQRANGYGRYHIGKVDIL